MTHDKDDDRTYYLSSLKSADHAIDDVWADPDGTLHEGRCGEKDVTPRDLQTLAYAARMVHESATTEEERERITEAARSIEDFLVTGYGFDDRYDYNIFPEDDE